MTSIKAIETTLYGRRFRSRNEARWAIAFTEFGITWDYEPQGFNLGEAGCYLPDFWLPQVSMWAEVKSVAPNDKEIAKAKALAEGSGFPCLLLVGQPQPFSYWAVEPDGTRADYCLFYNRKYHETESRFFADCGISGKFPLPVDFGEATCAAIEAALSARFEHGDSFSTNPFALPAS